MMQLPLLPPPAMALPDSGRHERPVVTALYYESGLPLSAFLVLVQQARTMAGRHGPWLVILVSLIRQGLPAAGTESD